MSVETDIAAERAKIYAALHADNRLEDAMAGAGLTMGVPAERAGHGRENSYVCEVCSGSGARGAGWQEVPPRSEDISRLEDEVVRLEMEVTQLRGTQNRAVWDAELARRKLDVLTKLESETRVVLKTLKDRALLLAGMVAEQEVANQELKEAVDLAMADVKSGEDLLDLLGEQDVML